MRRLLPMVLAAMVVFSVAACGSKGGQDTLDTEQSEEKSSQENSQENNSSPGEAEIPDALALLNAIWDSYGEDERFSAAGGDFSEENAVMDAPGKYSMEDGAALDSTLGLPEASLSMIDDVASLMHMMNANTFTCGAFHVGDAKNLSAVTDSLKDNILDRQWVCGFPDKLIVLTVGDYVISAFGNEEIIGTFKEKTMSTYESAVLVYEEPIV